MIKIGKFDEEDYEKYKEFVKFVTTMLEPNGEFYFFEYKGDQGFVYKIDEAFDIFLYDYEGDIKYIPIAYDSENDTVFVRSEGDICYDDDGTSIAYEDGNVHSMFCSYDNGGNTISYYQYNSRTNKELVLSYEYRIKNTKAQYLFWNEQKTPYMIMFRKNASRKLGLKFSPENSDVYYVDPSSLVCCPIKRFTDDGTDNGIEYSRKFWKYKQLTDMMDMFSKEGFNTIVPEEVLDVYNFRFGKFDYLSFVKEFNLAIAAAASYAYKLETGNSSIKR